MVVSPLKLLIFGFLGCHLGPTMGYSETIPPTETPSTTRETASSEECTYLDSPEPMPPTVVYPSQKVTLTCSCSGSVGEQFCPFWTIIEGKDYVAFGGVNITRAVNKQTGFTSYCENQFTLYVNSEMTVGIVRVLLGCSGPDTLLKYSELEIRSPEPDYYEIYQRKHLIILLCLGAIVFTLIVLIMFGVCLRRQRTRHNRQRGLAQTIIGNQGISNPVCIQQDYPPSYKEAIVRQQTMGNHAPAYITGAPALLGVPVQEKIKEHEASGFNLSKGESAP